MKNITITDIPLKEYEGYLWFSDQKRPSYITSSKPFRKEDLTKHPFVVEGALYSKEDNLSISIRSIDGRYLIHQFDLSALQNNRYRQIEQEWFVSKDSQRKVKMAEIWELTSDKLCEDMETYRPAFKVFMGFK